MVVGPSGNMAKVGSKHCNGRSGGRAVPTIETGFVAGNGGQVRGMGPVKARRRCPPQSPYVVIREDEGCVGPRVHEDDDSDWSPYLRGWRPEENVLRKVQSVNPNAGLTGVPGCSSCISTILPSGS